MKISNWLLKYDEKFLSIIKDEIERSNYLNQLYRYRIVCIVKIVIVGIFGLAGLFWGQNFVSMIALFLFVAEAMSYLDTDTRIREIKIYELVTDKDKKA